MFKLNEMVSKIVVDKNNPSKCANDIIRECKGAIVYQRNWKKKPA